MPKSKSKSNAASTPPISTLSPLNTLILMIDTHLATQLADSPPRRHSTSLPSPSRCSSSRGTMFVDFDQHTAEPIVSWREKECSAATTTNTNTNNEEWAERFNPVVPLPSSSSSSSSSSSDSSTPYPDTTSNTASTAPSPSPSPPLLTADHNLHVYRRRHHHHHDGRQNAIYIAGHDPNTRFEYDYDGRIVHVHKESPRPGSAYSDYYVVHAGEYAAQCCGAGTGYDPLLTLLVDGDDDDDDDDERVLLSPGESRKRNRVVGFIRGLMGRLRRLGLLERLGGDARGGMLGA